MKIKLSIFALLWLIFYLVFYWLVLSPFTNEVKSEGLFHYALGNSSFSRIEVVCAITPFLGFLVVGFLATRNYYRLLEKLHFYKDFDALTVAWRHTLAFHFVISFCLILTVGTFCYAVYDEGLTYIHYSSVILLIYLITLVLGLWKLKKSLNATREEIINFF
ncbi:hypothetical protein ABBZ21_19865 [Acinetobacter baumannii]|uniref:hypothetical protein n=1 Tax=Acinetobacter baumannii TaxID=470 RepID=UPI00385DD4F2